MRQRRKKAFIAFITAGDPNLKTTEKLVIAFEKAGVDLIELGVPFSDPLADGPTIQASSQRALKHQVNLSQILNLVKRIRTASQIPIALMTYYNPVFHFGEEKFVIEARKAGVDGLIIPDLPPKEASKIVKSAKNNRISTIFFLSPTTTRERMKEIIRASSGFIYYVSLTGVTGARAKLPASILHNVRMAKSFTHKPVCVGFGVSTSQQVKAISSISDGVIVGSSIVKEIARNSGRKDLVKSVAKFVGRLVQSLS